MPSAWHRDDDREYGDPPLEFPCDTDGCGGTVRIAAEDWHDNDAHLCVACVGRTVSRPHPVHDWPEDIPA